MRRPLERLLDANLNRVTEGLRVAEDLARFLEDAPSLQQGLKDLRHRVAACLPRADYVRHRDVEGDIGFDSPGGLEYRRPGVESLAMSNLKRAQEGLRVLEEAMKLVDPAVARTLKAARYEAYRLEQAFLDLRPSLGEGLYLVLTDPPQGYERLTALAVASGIAAVQLRYKGASPREHLALACRIRTLTRGSSTRFIVNDSLEIALLSEADGLHLGQDDLPADCARELLGTRALIGLSTHNQDQVAAADMEPVDYIGFGPVFPTVSKDNSLPARDLAALEAAVSQSAHPVVAIGGIGEDNLGPVRHTGVHNAAVLSAVSREANPERALRALQKIWMEQT